MIMKTTTLTYINAIIKDSYIKQKKDATSFACLSKPLFTAWEFIDNLFILEKESKSTAYYDILVFLIPLMKPETKEEKREVFIDYLNLIGISSNHDTFKIILDYYDASQTFAHAKLFDY